MVNSTRLTLAAAVLALASVPALAQTTKDMGKDSSMGTTSDGTKSGTTSSKSSGMKKEDNMGMKKDGTGMKKENGMASGTRGEDNSGKTTSGNTQGK